MRIASIIAPLVGSATAVAADSASGCNALKKSLGSSLFAQGTEVYEYEAQNFWSNTEIMSPGCVFRPQSSGQLAEGLSALVGANAHFAVRGGGHMGIRVCLCEEIACILRC